MKKLFLTALAAVIMSGAAVAQMPPMGVTVAKVDVAKLRDAIAKSDGEIADAKKNIKAATWLKRGDVFIDADAKPVNGLYMGMPEEILKLSFGDAPTEEVVIGGSPYTLYNYDHFKAYTSNGVIDFYVPVTIVDANALDKAYDAFDKAYQLDAKQVKKVATGMENIRKKSIEDAGSYYSLQDYATAAKDFRRAYKASIHSSMDRIDTMSLYYAGMSSALAGEYTTAIEDIDKAIAMGYESDGDVYRMKFLSLYSLDRKEESLEALKLGLSKYPTNEDLIDMMMRYYAENDGDPSSIIPLVQSAIDKNPSNPVLYQGLARVYDKLGRSDEAIDAIKKAVALTPDDFVSNYLEGLFILKKGDVMNEELGKMTITSRAQYQTALDAVNAVFAQALAPLEKAYELDPKEASTVELLKNLTFRLRDDQAMNAKYEKYNTLLQSM